VELNNKNKYQISINGKKINREYDNKIEAMQYAVKKGRETPNITDVIIRSDR